MNQILLDELRSLLQNEFHGDIDRMVTAIRSELHLATTTGTEPEPAFPQSVAESALHPDKFGEVIIDLQNLSKEYKMGRETIQALKDVSLEIREGEIVSLIGSSGSGKSTLLNLIGGLDRPSQGRITVHGKDLEALSDKQISTYRNETIGFVFQFFNLQPYLNVLENVEIPLIFRGEATHARMQAASEAVQAVGLEDRGKHLPNQLSGGQMQRVAIARSLVNKPKIILADEPTGNLDRQTGIEILNFMKKINREFGTTIIIVTHDDFVARQGHRIIKLSDGMILH